MTPRRSNVRKSAVVARLVVMPHRDTETYVMWNRPSMKVIRGSSTPNRSELVARSGRKTPRSASTVQSVSPSALRATQRLREARPILDAGEEDRLVAEARDAGVEDGVDGVGPVGRPEDRVPPVPLKQLRGPQGITAVVRNVL